MIKKILSTVTAISVSLTPVAVSSQEYFFRYRTASISSTVTPETPAEEYGVGNDIQAYFISPVGVSFSRKIPVSTRDVVNWVRQAGGIPSGIQLDRLDGVLEGVPDTAAQERAVYIGFDAQGNRIARAEIHFTVFEPIGVGSQVHYYTHTGQYFYRQLPASTDIAVTRWEPFPGYENPAGMRTRFGAFEGNPNKAGTYAIGWQGYNYLNEPVAYVYGDLLVEDGPTFAEDIDDQTIDTNDGESFSRKPGVKHQIGTITYRLVPSTIRPDGVTFSSATGEVGGAFVDFDTSAAFKIEARDSADGTLGYSNEFTLTTLPEELRLKPTKNLYGSFGKYFEQGFAPVDSSGNARWHVTAGELPDGLELDELTGKISGTPIKSGKFEGIVVTVSGQGITTASTNPFIFSIAAEDLSFTLETKFVRVDEAFETAPPKLKKEVKEDVKWEMHESTPLPDGLTMANGVISSTNGIGTAGIYRYIVTARPETLSNPTAAASQYIRVYENLNPQYPATTTVRQNEQVDIRVDVDYAAVHDRATYAITGSNELPSWLSINSYGRITGSPDSNVPAGTYGPFGVSITDGLQKPFKSNQFYITVEAREKLVGTIVTPEVERYVYNGTTKPLAMVEKQHGQVTFELLDRGTLPDTLDLTSGYNRAYIIGKTTDPVGTVYTGIKIKATDADGNAYSWTSEPFDITVVQPADPRPISGTLEIPYTWAEGQPLRDLALPTVMGTYGNVTYTLDANPFGLTLQDGTIGNNQTVRKLVIGQVNEAGVYEIGYEIKDELDRDPLKGTLKLTIQPPVSLKTEENVTAFPFNRGTYGEARMVREYGIPGFTYWIAPNTASLPKGLVFDYNSGMIFGTPEVEGTFPFTAYVRDKTGNVSNTGVFNLIVDKPLPFSFTFPTATVTKGAPAKIRPEVVNSLGAVQWSVTGDMPPGMSFDLDAKSPTYGSFIGTPQQAGIYDKIKVVGYDTGSTVRYPEQGEIGVTIKVTIPGEVEFESASFKARAGAASRTFVLKPTNVIPDVNFSFAEGADRLVGYILFNEDTGEITGSFPEIGSYSTAVTATDLLGRQGTTTVTFDAVGELKANAPTSVTLDQYVTKPIAVTVDNAVGEISYSLASGSPALPGTLTLNKDTGVIEGEPTEVKAPTTYRVVATDAFDNTTTYVDVTIEVKQREQLTAAVPPLSFKQYQEIAGSVVLENEITPIANWSILPSLPTGLYFTDGAFSGSLNTTFNGTFQVTVVDAKGGSLGTATTEPFTLKIEPRDQLTLTGTGEPATSFKQHQDVGSVTAATVSNDIAKVNWSIEPKLPSGLYFNDGVITGKPTEALTSTTFTIKADDGKGGNLGKDEYAFTLSVDARDPLKITGPDTFAFNQYFEGYFDLGSENAIDSETYTVTPALPAGFTLDDKTGRMTATADAKFSAVPYTFRVTDGVGDYSDKTIVLSVVDRKLPEIATDNARPIPALVGYKADTTLSKKNVLGQASWQLVSGTLPNDMYFDETNGAFRGVPSEFGLFENIVIRLFDTYEGVTTASSTKTFSINVAQDGSAITLTVAGKDMRVGHSLRTDAPVANNTVGDVTWTATGLSGTGLSIDAKTGVISGTATEVGTITATVAVTDVTARSAEAVVTINIVPELTLSMSGENDLLFNYTLTDAGVTQPAVDNSYGPLTWSINGANTLPDELYFDLTTGTFEGKPEAVGAFGPVMLTVGDALPGTKTVGPIWFTVYMNDDPIDLAVTNVITKVGYTFISGMPTYDNVLGPPNFFSLDLAGTNIEVNPTTGVMTGSFNEVIDRTFNLSITDETLRVTSKPVRVQVLPKMTLTAPESMVVSAQEPMAPVKVTRLNAVGAATWNPVDPTLLPEGMTFNTSLGQFEGNPQVLGDFGPITVTSTDSLGDVGTSNPIMIRSQAGAYFLSLASATLPNAMKRIEPYTYDFKPLITAIGMDVSEITWSISAGTTGTPPGISINSLTGILSGTPTLSGVYNFQVTATGLGGKKATKDYTLEVKLPVINLDIGGAIADAEVNTDYSFDLTQLITTNENIAKTSVKFAWSLDSDPAKEHAYPPGLAISGQKLTGKPTASGDYKLLFTATFEDKTDEFATVTKEYVVPVKGKQFRYTQISAGDMFACGVTPKGALQCWGAGYSNNPQTVAALGENVASVSAGTTNGQGQYCVVTKEGAAKCYGANSYGHMGTGKISNLRGYWDVQGLQSGVAQIGIGGQHACAMLTTGEVKCWGANNQGQLGTGNTTTALTPTTVPGLESGVATLKVGRMHTCVQKVNGEVWCWGQGYANGTASSTVLSPDKLSLTNTQKLVTGVGNGCAINNTGMLYCWGSGVYNKLQSDNSYSYPSPRWMSLSGYSNSDAAIGMGHICALRRGVVSCWGLRESGQLGNGIYSRYTYQPQVVSNITTAASITAGDDFSCALLDSGQAQCWGDNDYGQLGNWKNTNSGIPVPVGDL
ncbi:putative Ig domain-containing protein [Rhizobium sp. MHM7A]|uniref:putative Ig domain-containing protein n=1 Tax=Rhizobium sp. MHM7A TaxID=2583233 RepID=UPI001106DE40|nr:putative Ig domain-containing protein [Rhizobium sp. MHM7A]TLX17071.1 hypothetical protein FFR93_07090 [Rhizobium sp. MHM7A]